MKQKIASGCLRIVDKLFLSKMSKKVKFQYFFEYLHALSLKGMNYDNTKTLYKNGEIKVFEYIFERSRKKTELIIFDVGANVGDYSNAAFELFSKKYSPIIHTFEPSQRTFEKLKQHITINTINIYNIGLSYKEDVFTLYSSSHESLSGLSSVYKRDLSHHDINFDATEEVKMTTLDIFCTKNNIKEIDLLKLDIEGNELNALNGGLEMLKNKKINFIQFEFGGTDIDSKTFFRDFYNLLKGNYKIYRIVKDGIFEIRDYNEHREIFGSINFLAELKQL